MNYRGINVVRARIRITRDKYDGISPPFIAGDERRPDRRVPSTTWIRREINEERRRSIWKYWNR